ncbi:MAG: hypothetical protein ACF8XB_00580 [Planctomycetota bacterium JB042]
MQARTKILICAAFSGTTGLVFGAEIPLERQLPLYESLRTTSSIIFGVLGAWIAIVHPEALRELLQLQGKPTGATRPAQVRLILRAMQVVAVILLSVLAYGPIAEVLRTFDWLARHPSIPRAVSFSILCALTIAQVWTIFAAAYFPEQTNDDLKAMEDRTESEHILFGRGDSSGRP